MHFFNPSGVDGEKLLRIVGVEIFGVKFWSAQHEPKQIPKEQRFFHIENRCETQQFGHVF